MNWQVIFTLAAFSGICVKSFPTQQSFGDAGKIAEPVSVKLNDLSSSSSLLELSEFAQIPSLAETDSSFALSKEIVQNPTDVNTLADESQANTEWLNGLHKIWLRAARILALRPDLLRWVSSLTPEHSVETPEPSLTPDQIVETPQTSLNDQTIPFVPAIVKNNEQDITILDSEILVVEATTVSEEQIVFESATEKYLPQTIFEEKSIEMQPEFISEPQNEQMTVQSKNSEISIDEAMSITELPLEPQVLADIDSKQEAMPIVEDVPQIAVEQENTPQALVTELLAPETLKPLAEPESKQSQAKLKLDIFKERNFKKGKTLLEESIFSNFNSNFPSYSYSFRHIPVHG